MDKSHMLMGGFLLCAFLLLCSLVFTDNIRADLEKVCELTHEYFQSTGVKRVPTALRGDVAEILDICKQRGIPPS